MPALPSRQIVRAIVEALDECGASSMLLSEVHGNPRRFMVQYGRGTFELWTYVWTLTHGGGSARPQDEYRIQLTGVRPPLALNPSGPTLLLGYEPDIGCFAGFDVQKHKTFSTHSPSIQVAITTLHDALQFGFSFVTKGNEEIAIGIRSDQFLAYVLNGALLHREGADAAMVDLLTQAVGLEEAPAVDALHVTEERKRILREVAQLSRDAGFRRKVLRAYDQRCAVTRMQLRLIDAAHILPVGAEGSTDGVSNGLCLSPTYHRAFDRALVYLDDQLRMQIDPKKEQELIDAGLAGGLEDFKANLGRRIHLPQERSQWPNLEFVLRANDLRMLK